LPLRPQTITDRFQKRAERLGLPVIRLRDTRHGATSLLLAAGMPIETVALIIGHANVSTVREIYAHIQKTPASKGMAAAVSLVRGDRRAQSVHRSDDQGGDAGASRPSSAGQALIH
jgi:integrase